MRSHTLFLKLLVLVLLPVFFFLGGSLWVIQHHETETSNHSLDRGLVGSRTYLRSLLAERWILLDSQAARMAARPELTDWMDLTSSAPQSVQVEVARLAPTWQARLGARLFVLSDAAGGILYDSSRIPEPPATPFPTPTPPYPGPLPPPPAPQPTLVAAPDLKVALSGNSTRGLWISRPGTEPHIPQQAYLAVTHPLMTSEPEKTMRGALVLGSPLDQDWAEELKRTTGSDIVLVDGGQVLASSWTSQDQSDLEEALAPAIGATESQDSSEPLPIDLTFRGTTYRALFESLVDLKGQSSASVVLLRSRSQIETTWTSLRKAFWKLAASALGLALVLSFLFYRRLRKPLESLRAAFTALGQGSPSTTIEEAQGSDLSEWTRSFNAMVRSLRQQGRVAQILGNSFSPLTARKILASGEELALKGEKRECALLAAGLRGFETQSRNLPPEKLVSELNEFCEFMTPVVFNLDGALDKITGDGFLAYWGAPLHCEDMETRAWACVQKLQAAVQTLNEKRSERGAPPLALGIGLHRGTVVAGNFGSERQAHYSLWGAEVQRALALGAQAPPGLILMTEAFLKRLPTRVPHRPAPPLTGLDNPGPLRIFEALAPGD